jgi:hypothetical protein
MGGWGEQTKQGENDRPAAESLGNEGAHRTGIPGQSGRDKEKITKL